MWGGRGEDGLVRGDRAEVSFLGWFVKCGIVIDMMAVF